MKLNTEFYPLETLHGKQIDLKEISMDDAASLFELRSNEEVMKFIERPRTTHLQEAKDMIQKMDEYAITGNGFSWGIYLIETGSLIGTIGFYRIDKENLRGEVGYLLHPNFWGKGIMSEALQLALEYGFATIKFHSIIACIHPENEASRNLLRRHHFQKEAYHRENTYFNNQFYDTEVLALLASEHKTNNS